MREKIIIEILSKCINFLDTNQCNQLRLTLENKIYLLNNFHIITHTITTD